MGVVSVACDLLGLLHLTVELVFNMRYLALILAFISPLAFAIDVAPQSLDNLKNSAAPAKKDFASGKAELMDSLEFRKKMEAKVYLSRKKILDTTVECVKKAKDSLAVMKCNDAERKLAFDSVNETQKLLSEFAKKMNKTRKSLGLPEPMSPEEASIQAAAAKANENKNGNK